MDLPVQLGPTGMTGYVYRHGIVVRTVEPESPAAGIVEALDYVVEIDGREIPEGADPRRLLGAAIEAAESGDGSLRLGLLRAGQRKRVVLRLEKLGGLSESWPFDCEKSERILDDACAYLMRHQYSALLHTNHVTRACNALLLLARGEPQDLELARRAAYVVVDDPLTAGYQGWSRSYSGILLAEYYLATHDPVVVPKLRELARTIPAGQMACGSWGHRMPFDGYGAVNQIGLACYLAMILIEDCGIPVDAEAMERSRNFFARYAGKGWIPYGDHTPWRGRSGNGKNALAAVAYDVLGGHENVTREFAISTAASYEYREEGHTGAFFSFLWGPLGAAQASREEFRRFLDQQRWYYALARRRDGGLVCQPNPENLSGRTPGIYTRWGAAGTTGAMALVYAIPGGKLRISGKGEERQEVRDARVRAVDAFAVSAIREDVERGDHWLARQRLAALERARGALPEGLRDVGQRIAAERDAVRQGEQYHRALRNASTQRRAWRSLVSLARERGYYAELARRVIEKRSPPRPRARRWRKLWDSRNSIEFDRPDSSGGLELRARCAAGVRVHLNGVCIAEFGEAVGRRGPQAIALPKEVEGLLRARGNRMRLEGSGTRDRVELHVGEGER